VQGRQKRRKDGGISGEAGGKGNSFVTARRQCNHFLVAAGGKPNPSNFPGKQKNTGEEGDYMKKRSAMRQELWRLKHDAGGDPGGLGKGYRLCIGMQHQRQFQESAEFKDISRG